MSTTTRPALSAAELEAVRADFPLLGRTLRGLKITADEMPAYVERVTRRFAADREPRESFASWAHRAEEEALR